MSPALRLKSKDRKPEKEVSSNSSKPSSQTFETTVPPAAPSPINRNNIRYQNPDDTDDQNTSGGDYDSISNGGSWSGESEDHKEKPSQQPVLQSDSGTPDRREKIRQKNEKKHQRQKEKRARELHERCCALLMSRKLEALAQQLVSMGFPHERATTALILNEGRVEESVAWILEGTEEEKHKEQSLDCRSKLKIDISEELTHIKAFETQYMASKQVVERAVVSCAGDLDKAEEMLRPKSEEEPGDPPTVPVQQNLTRMQPGSAPSITIVQQNNEIKGSSTDTGTKTVQMLKKPAPKLGLAKPQPVSVPVEKRWVSPGPNLSTSPPLAVSKAEPQYFPVSNGLPYLQLGTIKPGSIKPGIFVQPHPTPTVKPAPTASLGSSSPGMAKDWIPNSLETMQQSRGFVGSNPLYSKGMAKDWIPNSLGTMQQSRGLAGSNPLYSDIHRPQFWEFMPSSADPSTRIAQGNLVAPTLGRAASSLGLFARHTSSVPLDPMDFRNVDWSMDEGSMATSSSRSGGFWGAMSGNNSIVQNHSARKYDSLATYGIGAKSYNFREPEIGYRGSGVVGPTTNPGLWDWAMGLEEEEESCDVGRRYV